MSNRVQPLTIKLNGEKRELNAGVTLLQLLQELSIPKEKVVIEVNLDIIPKDDWSTRALKHDDEVEIVHFVGGGAHGAKALVIVESPAKCKTILKYLGNNFEVTASMGM